MMAEMNDEEIPEFKSDYIKAFMALMLLKVGGSEIISLELLEKFPEEECPIVGWNPEKKAFILISPKRPKKRKRGIVKPRILRI